MKKLSLCGRFRRESFSLDVSLALECGDHRIVTGPSGAGKSTLLQLAAGILPLKEGARTIVGSFHYQPQSDFLLPWKSIYENLVFTHKSDQSYDLLLQKIGVVGCMERYPHELSHGMRQRVSFIRTLFSGADFLLFDEPFAHVDAAARGWMISLLEEEKKRRSFASLIVTHGYEEELCGDAFFVREGRAG